VEDLLIFDAQMPELYHNRLGPFCFLPYAQESAQRLSELEGSSLLEIASGTGIVTHELDRVLGDHWRILATDISVDMLDLNRSYTAHSTRTTYEVVDALNLPYEDNSFDVVLCHFGWMFFPDKDLAAREALRVLKPGGTILIAVWGSLAENPAFETAGNVIAECFPDDPPNFLMTPFGYHVEEELHRLVNEPGFVNVSVQRISKIGNSESAFGIAEGFYGGTPMVLAIAKRDASRLGELREKLTAELTARLGDAPLKAPMVAVYVTAEKP